MVRETADGVFVGFCSMLDYMDIVNELVRHYSLLPSWPAFFLVFRHESNRYVAGRRFCRCSVVFHDVLPSTRSKKDHEERRVEGTIHSFESIIHLRYR